MSLSHQIMQYLAGRSDEELATTSPQKVANALGLPNSSRASKTMYSLHATRRIELIRHGGKIVGVSRIIRVDTLRRTPGAPPYGMPSTPHLDRYLLAHSRAKAIEADHEFVEVSLRKPAIYEEARRLQIELAKMRAAYADLIRNNMNGSQPEGEQEQP